jgi:hypothetical protein
MDSKQLEQRLTDLERDIHKLPPKEFRRRLAELKREIAKLPE